MEARANTDEIKGLIELGEFFNNFKIPTIENYTKFWMIRSKGGYFYNEFVNSRFVALAWNYLDQKTVFTGDNLELLKDGVKERYGDKVPQTAINKCDRFINDIQPGDFVVIPSKGSDEITIGTLGEYYEEDYSDTHEIVCIKKIENKEYEIGEVSCPYRKRRKLNVLLRASSNRMGYKLLKGMSSNHGLTDLNDYAVDILNCVYDCYCFDGDMMLPINVAKKSDVSTRELSGLLYGITSLFSGIIDEDLIKVSVNINSPGKVVPVFKGGAKILAKNWKALALIAVLLGGGSFAGFELPSIPGIIKNFQSIEIEKETAEEELKSKQLDNYLKSIEVFEAAKELGIDEDTMIDNMKLLENLSKSMNFENNEKFAKEAEGKDQNE